ncbi:MAG TPA: NAD(P)H-binding protein [Candidatus Binataceae bacterium]|nr:NAD(P)H-binding protein [Candidatus Binataceae bacterium]
MAAAELNVVTGALGYTGRYIAQALLARGLRVRTLTNHPAQADPFAGRVEVAPLDFSRPEALAQSLDGATTLFNTYWIRFPYGATTFDSAVANSRTLLRVALAVGVRRIVHISITHADERSPLPYFRGKGLVERAIVESGLSYLIIRPTLIFGGADILLNNVAWLLRRSPLFALPGRGDYRVQPVFVEDVATLAISGAAESRDRVVDAAGPEIYTFRNLVRAIARAVHSRALVVPAPAGLALLAARLIGHALGDITLTRDEIAGLSAGLLVASGAPTCPTRLSAWLEENAGRIGEEYASELARRAAAQPRRA